jgi:hypothetical protein
MQRQQDKVDGAHSPDFEVVSDVIKVTQLTDKGAGVAGGVGKAAGLGAAHHGGMVAGAGAGGGFLTGKATGLKLGLGLGGFGGPLLLAALCGVGGLILYRAVRNGQTTNTQPQDPPPTD